LAGNSIAMPHSRSNEALATRGVPAAGEARRVAANIARLPALLRRAE
jgi:hypothetical protein